MKKSDFLQILESFPGKMQLRDSSAELLALEYSYVKFAGIARETNKFKSLDLPKNNEELWFKFLAFLLIATELEEENNIPNINLSSNSQQVADRIVSKFNAQFHDSRNIIQDISGITLEELIEFAKSGESLI